MRRLILLLGMTLPLMAADQDHQPPTVVSKVEPSWVDLNSGYLVEETGIQLSILPSGEPDAVRGASDSLPDPVVHALAHWRFSPYKQDKHAPELLVSLRVPIRRKLNPDLERALRPRWLAPPDLRPALARANQLDSTKAANLFANLPQGEIPEHNRASLLLYYSQKATAAETATAIQVRRDLLLWLIHTFPQDPILTSSYAIINAQGEPLADAPGAFLVKEAWRSALKDYPKDILVAAGAANFLRTADSSAALRIISEKSEWENQSSFLGELYASAGLGVNVVAPGTGEALATAPNQLIDTGLAASFRKALLESADLELVLSAVGTIAVTARELKANNALPAGYDGFCDALMRHTRSLYPQTSLDCAINAASKNKQRTYHVAMAVAKSNLLKSVTPLLPRDMKKHPPTGSVRLLVYIDTQGHVQNIELLSGPLSLYDATCYAVRQWQYKPFLVGGNAVNVSTDVVVNFGITNSQ